MPAGASFAEDSCRLCGTKECPSVLSLPQFRVRRCPQCETLWCDPLRFDTAFNPDNEDAYLEVDDEVKRENAGRLAFAEHFVGPATHPRVVEIGCMHGDFVAQASSAGFDAVGLDLSSTAVAWAAEHRPGLVELGTLDAATPDGSVDVVAAFNVVEHMEDPGEFLDHVHRVLRVGGVLVVETPAQESLYHHVLFARAKYVSRGKDVPMGMHPGTHIFKFGKKAWSNVLERRGFEVLEIESKSTPLRELLAKNKDRSLVFRSGIVGVGALARATGLGNRVLVAARKR